MSGPRKSSAARSEADRAALSSFVEALDRGELDAEAPASTNSRALAPLGHLFRAIARARSGDAIAARRDALAAASLAPKSPLIVLSAARVLLASGEGDAASALLDDLAKQAGSASLAALDVTFEAAQKRGQWAHALGAIERAMAADPSAVDRHLRAAQFFLSVGEDEAAFAAIELAAKHTAIGAGTRLQGASILARLGRSEQAATWVADAVRAAEASAQVKLDGASVLLDAGAIDAARALIDEAIALAPNDPRALAMRATIALWAGDLDGAIEGADRALRSDPRNLEAHRTRGAALLKKRAIAEAQEALDRALALGDDRETWVWRAEALSAAGDDREALRAADHAREMSGDYPAAALVRMRIHLRLLDPKSARTRAQLTRYAYEELLDLLEAVCPGEDAALDSGDPKAIVALLDRALERLGGNRSLALTCLDKESDRLVPIALRPSPRFAAKVAQWRIRSSPPEIVLSLFDQVLSAYPLSSLPHCYRGELHLWLGQVAEARADFERSLERDPLTRFAHLGLSAVCLMEGDPKGALDCAAAAAEMMPRSAPPLYAYRGEAHRLAGNLDEALVDLTRAVEVSPSRISAWLNLGLVHHALGHRAEVKEIHDRLQTKAFWLLRAAARVGTIETEPQAPEVRARLFEQALMQMRGNRSSTCVTYFSANGALSVVGSHAEPRSTTSELAAIRSGLSRAAGLSR